MSGFSESLTVQIVGDSGPLQRELESVSRRIEEFASRWERMSEVSAQLGANLAEAAQLTRPLQVVSGWLDRLGEQIVALSQIPLTLNVEPALGSLAAVAGALDGILAQLLAFNAFAGLAGGGQGMSACPIRQFAEGGPVLGMGGRDQVPALLTTGEYVLTAEAASELGWGTLAQLNEHPREVRERGFSQQTHSSSVVNHVGGITIQVRQPGDVGQLVTELQRQGFALRNRRG